MAVTQATTLADFTSGIGTAGAVFQVDNANNRIGIGTTNPQSLLDVDGDSTFRGKVHLLDDDKLHFGGAEGDSGDLQIYHDGANSYVSDQGTGDLRLSGNVVKLNNQANTATMIKATEGGSVELNHNNSKKFETTGIGVSVSNGAASTATIAGPANLVIDPTVVGDNTGLVRIKGDLFVDGTQTVINSTTLEISDFIVGIASTATTDLLTDGAGIGIGSDKTFLYEHNGGTNASLKSSENLNVATGKVYQIGETERLSADTLSVGTGATVHSPNSNTLTLGTNGSERVRITSDGDVGIGTDNPDGLLEIYNPSESGNTVLKIHNDKNGDAAQLCLEGKRTSDNDTGQVLFKNNNYSVAGILVYSGGSGNHDNGSLTFRTSEVGSSNVISERLRITSAGDVGIGVTNPTSFGPTLQVSGTDPALLLQDTATSVDYFGVNVTSGKTQLWYDDAAAFTINTATGISGSGLSEKLRITPAGNVGINTTNPGNRLDVFDQDGFILRLNSDGFRVNQTYTNWTNTTYAENPIIMWDYKSGPGDHVFFASGGNTAVGNQMAMLISDGHGFKVGKNGYDGTDSDVDPNNEFFRITTDGSVGIGTNAPGGKVHVESPAATAGWQIRTDSDGLSNESGFYRDANDDYEVVIRNGDGGLAFIKNNGGSSNPNLHFHVGTTEKMRITSDGSVGINTTNPQAELHVRGTIYQTDIEYPSIRPTLDLNFAATKTLDRRITFTRDGVGTYYDELGVIRYASNNVPRFDHDPDTGESLGLLVEEPRTNLVSYSYYQGNGSVQTSGTINNWGLLFTSGGSASLTPGIDAPDGSNNAVRFTNLNTGDSILRINIDAFTPNGSDTYTLSFWARAISGTGGMSCDLADGSPNGTWTDQLVTNKWVRIVKSGVPSNASKTFIDIISNVNNNRVVDFWGLQLEKGSFITSYIPTSGSTVTRAADIAKITGTNFSSWFNNTEGTIDVSYRLGLDTTASRIFQIGKSTTTNDLLDIVSASGAGLGGYFYVNYGGVNQGNGPLVTNSAHTNSIFKVAAAYKTNDVQAVNNKTTTVFTDTTVNIPSGLDELYFCQYNGGDQLNGHLQTAKYYPKRLPLAQLQGLTQQ